MKRLDAWQRNRNRNRRPPTTDQSKPLRWGLELLMQRMAEWSIELAVIAEPYKVSDCPNWISNEAKSVAIVRGEQEDSSPVRALERAQDFIAAK